MALTDLRVPYNGAGATLYAIIRKSSDYSVWNGSAFEVWADGNIATYDVALTDQGGDEYSVAFPSAITAGDYIIDYYEQAGATPALTDLRLTGERVHWDGTALSDTSTVTLSAYALTTLTGVKRHLSITATTYDTKLTELINFISEKIETICGLKFKVRDYRQRYNTFGQRKLVLRARPVQHVTRISYGLANAMTVTYSGAAIRANASVYADPELYDAGGVRLVTVNTSGVKTANNLTFASYPSLTLLKTAIEAVSGWTATVLANMPSGDLHPTGGEDAKSRTVTWTYPDRDEDVYTLDQRRGIVTFDSRQNFPWGGDGCPRRFWFEDQGCLVEYRGGYETIPGDVELVCRELVKEAFITAVQSYSLGPFSQSFSNEMETRVRTKLAHFIDHANIIGGAA
jgi:hypothetical protein